MAKIRSRRLLWQIYPVFVITIILAVVAIGWYFSTVLKQFHDQDSVESFARPCGADCPADQGTH